jgi:hypothetical protein
VSFWLAWSLGDSLHFALLSTPASNVMHASLRNLSFHRRYVIYAYIISPISLETIAVNTFADRLL